VNSGAPPAGDEEGSKCLGVGGAEGLS
jgi:hypothetical protein